MHKHDKEKMIIVKTSNIEACEGLGRKQQHSASQRVSDLKREFGCELDWRILTTGPGGAAGRFSAKYMPFAGAEKNLASTFTCERNFFFLEYF